MTIPTLTTANTFSEWMNDTQQLIALSNALTDGPTSNANTHLTLSKLTVANMILTGPFTGANTAMIAESSSNLYFTAARVRANVSNTHPINYNPSTGVYSLAPTMNTSFVQEDANTNLYFTAARVRANVSNTHPINYDPSTGVFSLSPEMNTSLVMEGAYLYFTVARVRSNVSNTHPINYDSVNGIFSLSPNMNTSFVQEDANTNLYFTNTRARGALSASAPIVYDSGTGRFSHGTSTVVPGVHGNANSVSVVTADANGHITALSNVKITQKVSRNHLVVSNREGVNFIPGPNVSILVYDDAANDQSNVVIDGLWGGGQNPQGYVRFIVQDVQISQNTNTVNFLAGAGLSVAGRFDPAGVTEAEVYIYANNIYDHANAAYAQGNSASIAANTNATAAKIRANVSNTAPINYDSGTGIFSHAASGVSATGYGSATQVPVFVVNALGHVTSVTNTAIDYTGARTVLANTAPINYDSSTGTYSHATSGVGAGSYGSTTQTIAVVVNASGHITSIANTAISYTGARTVLANTAPINYDSSTGTYSHAASGVTATGHGSATQVPVFVVNASGHVTSVTNTAITYTGARSVLSNTAPINYDSSTGTYSHATSGVSATGYGDSVNIPVLVVNASGHVTAVTNTAIRAATTSVTGIVQLTDSVGSTSTTTAATPNAVKTTYDALTSHAATHGTMHSQNANNVNITGGTVANTSVSATRVAEEWNSYSPGSGAGQDVAWSKGGSHLTNSGTNTLTFSSIPSGLAGHLLRVSNLNSTTFPGTVSWGLGGKPSIAGEAIVSMVTYDGGTTVYATVIWRAVYSS